MQSLRDADTDVLIVGGGPAGLATAIAARREGLTVRVVDRRQPPIDKACGEGLMPDGLAILENLGVELTAAHSHPFRGIRYFDGDSVAEGRFPAVAGVGVRRLHLHAALLRRAQQAGVELEWGVKVEAFRAQEIESVSVETVGVETNAGRRRARWIVGADGLRSKVRAWAGLDTPAARRQRFGVRRHFRLRPWSDCVEVYWADHCEAYVTPVAADEVGVAILWSGHKANFESLLLSFPRLAAHLEHAPKASKDRGIGPLHQKVRGVAHGRVALVGDASGYVDAITGEGLSLAFHQAEALAAALRSGNLRVYRRQHRKIAALPDAMTRLLLWVERHPVLRRRVIRALAREPAVFSRLLAIHCRALPVRRLGLETAPRLLWRLVQS